MKKISTINVEPLTEPTFRVFTYTCPNCGEKAGATVELGKKTIIDPCPHCGSLVKISLRWHEA